MAQPMTIGVLRWGVVSQCPPMIAIPSSSAAVPICLVIVSTVVFVDFSGRSMVESMNFGWQPNVATSFALMFTASQPMLSVAAVMGSIEEIMEVFPMLMTAPSIPADGPRAISGRSAPRFLKTVSFRISRGIFPGGKVMYVHSRDVIRSEAFKLCSRTEPQWFYPWQPFSLFSTNSDVMDPRDGRTHAAMLRKELELLAPSLFFLYI